LLSPFVKEGVPAQRNSINKLRPGRESIAIRVTLALLLLLQPGGQVASPSPASANQVTLDALLRELREQTGVPGLSAAVAVRGELLWHGETGLADVAAAKHVTPQTVFRLASVSKAVCSILAAKLIEDGTLSVDARVGEHLPALPPQYHDLRFRDLMTHTSGLPHYQPMDASRGGKRFSSAVAGLEQLGNRDLVSPPGGDYLYSTHGFSLASALMERASRTAFPNLLKGLLLAAQPSSDLALESQQANHPRRARIYEPVLSARPRELPRKDFSYSWCGAGMESSAISLSRLASSLFGGDSPLGEHAQSLIREPLPDRHGKQVSGDRWVMTLGWRRSTDSRGKIFLHHAGVTDGARSIVAVWPDDGVAVSLLSNAAWVGRMEDTAVALAIAAQTDSEPVSCPRQGQQSYVGTFDNSPVRATIFWRRLPSLCRGEMTSESEVATWLRGYNFARKGAYTLIPLDHRRWGLVTSIGISVLEGEAGNLSGAISSRPLRLARTK